jgi:hypothetical protein
MLCESIYLLIFSVFRFVADERWARLQLHNNPVHTPAAVDYIMFNFGEFLSISNFVLKKAAIYGVKAMSGQEIQKEINLAVSFQ